MKKEILEKLASIEKEKGVEILFAVESGSRAWGFASPDSDYDIRFVYRHKSEWYLDLWESKDTIQFMTEDDLDGSGWDVRKALRLLAKSNSSLLGWLFSPIVYMSKGSILEKFKDLAVQNFNPVAGFYHYDSMSRSYQEKLTTEALTIKQFFYAIRTGLSAKWILEKQTIPAVEFLLLCDLLDITTRKEIMNLVELKSQSDEKSIVMIPKKMIEFTCTLIEDNKRNKEQLVGKSADKEMFNTLFIDLLK